MTVCRRAVPLFLAAVFAACSTSPPVPDMEEGQWEMTTTMKMPGMPFAMPPVRFSQCLTRKDLIPRERERSSGCTVVSSSVRGDTVSWTMTCGSPQGATTTTGSVTYTGRSLRGTITVRGGGLPQPVTQTMTGRWIGPCD